MIATSCCVFVACLCVFMVARELRNGLRAEELVREGASAEQARIVALAEEYGAVYPTCPCDTQAGVFAEHLHGSPAPFADLIRDTDDEKGTGR